MVKWRYEIQTGISIKFDPEVEGATLGSIMSSCSNVLSWNIPFSVENATITFDARRKISIDDINYLKGQLEVELDNDYFVMRRIEEGKRDSRGRLNY